MNETIYPAKYYPIYKAWKTVGGWIVVYLADRYTMRNVDGGKVHKSRQHAYAKAKRLNDGLPKPLAEILQKADTAWYEWDSYNVYVGESANPEEPGYDVSICKEAMPPHVYRTFATLDEVEAYMDQSLGYTRDSRAWRAIEED